MPLRVLDKISASKIRNGDVETFEKLIKAHQDRVFSYCFRTLNNYHLAEDVTQEVFIKVYKNIESYNWQKASLSTWIFTITHNTCINNMRNSYSELPTMELGTLSQPNSTEDECISREGLDKLVEAIRSLAPEDRSLVIFKDYLGLKYREVGNILNLPVGTVKSRIHNIRMKIRILIGDYYD